MSWYNRKMASYAFLVGGLLLLSGCGFRPLYNQPAATGGGYNVQLDMATIHIEPIRDRIGQQLHNMLLTRLNPVGEPARPQYNLRVTLSESVQELGIRKSSFATRANLRVNANYSLVMAVGKAAATTDPLPSGNILAISSYDISTSEFTTLAARKDARVRAIREIADDLRTRLAVYFAQNRR